MTGEKFLRGLLTPIDPRNVFFMIQAGYPIDFIPGLAVESLNGVRSRSASVAGVRDADPDFVRVPDSLSDLQATARVAGGSAALRASLLSGARRFGRAVGQQPFDAADHVLPLPVTWRFPRHICRTTVRPSSPRT
jgi:hypothetical protein